MSLLDDVSIVVTPNGYKAGTLFAVKPTDVLGAEEITNGDFSNGLTGWTENGGSYATIVSGALNSNNPDAGNWYAENISQNVSFVNGTTYKLTFKAKNISGNLNLRITQGANAMASLDLTSTFVNYTYFYTANADNGSVRIFCNSAVGQFEIDDISVKEVTGADMDVTRATAATRVDEDGLVNYAEVIGSELVTNGDFDTDTDWTKGTGWTISGGNLNASSPVGTVATAQSVDGLTAGKTYKVSFEVSEITSGYFRLYAYVGASGTFTNIFSSPELESGTYETTFEFGGTDKTFRIYGAPNSASALTVGSVSNISIKEVTRDNVPRIDYTGGGCPHILAEPQRTNLITYSEDFSNAIYIKDSTVSVGTTNNVSPSGESNATKIDVTASGRIYANVTTGTYTTSVFIKAGTFAYFKIAGVQVDLVAETNANGTIESFGNGWFKVGVNYTGNRPFQIQAYPDGSYATHTTSGNYFIWGSQIEEGSYATSYIPTSGSTVTRNQDIFTRDGIGSLINSTEGVLFVEMAYLNNTGNYKSLSISDGTTDNRVTFENRPVLNQIKAFVNVSGTNVMSSTQTLTDVKEFNKMALKWKQNDFAWWVNGVEIYTDTSGNTFSEDTLNRLAFDRGDGFIQLEGKVKQLQVYDTALTDTQLAALTS